MKTINPAGVGKYMLAFPEPTRAVFEQIRSVIKKAAPACEETISYGIPAFMLNDSYIVYVGAYKKHISIYPAPVSHPDFISDFAGYKTSKGTIRFPLDQPLPMALIRRIVKHLLAENKKRSKLKKGK